MICLEFEHRFSLEEVVVIYLEALSVLFPSSIHQSRKDFIRRDFFTLENGKIWKKFSPKHYFELKGIGRVGSGLSFKISKIYDDHESLRPWVYSLVSELETHKKSWILQPWVLTIFLWYERCTEDTHPYVV